MKTKKNLKKRNTNTKRKRTLVVKAGTIPYTKGDIYEVKIKDGKRNGLVKLTYKNGDIYEGKMKDGKRNGLGKMTYKNGDIYIGNWVDGQKNGQGTMIYIKDGVYNGNWKDAQKEGNGIMSYINGNKYDGNWKNDKINGEGKMTYKNGDIYIGNWVDGQMNGEGKLTYPDGNYFDGNWEKDKKNYDIVGIIKVTYKDGDVYEGEWLNNKRNGEGKFTLANGNYFDCFWINNEIDNTIAGKIKVTYKDGNVYEGEWLNNKRNGEGKLTYPNGQSINGIWKDNIFSGVVKCSITDKNNKKIEDNTELKKDVEYTIKENEIVKYTFTFSKLPLGKGGFGTVNLCKKGNSGNSELCEYNIVKSQDITKKYHLDITLKEVELLQQIKVFGLNKYFVEYNYSCFFGNKYLIFMEKMDVSLHDFIYNENDKKNENYDAYYNNKNFAHICDQLLRGLQLLHKNGIYHKDIKPDNIMLTLDKDKNKVKKVKYVDFGLSCDITNYPCDGIIGTNDYMCPLITDGNLKDEKDLQKIDRFALGMTFYELFYRKNYLINNLNKEQKEKFLKVVDKKNYVDKEQNFDNLRLRHLKAVIEYYYNFYKNHLLNDIKNLSYNENNEEEKLKQYISDYNKDKNEDESTYYYLPIYDLVNYKVALKPIGPFTQENNDIVVNSTDQPEKQSKINNIDNNLPKQDPNLK